MPAESSKSLCSECPLNEHTLQTVRLSSHIRAGDNESLTPVLRGDNTSTLDKVLTPILGDGIIPILDQVLTPILGDNTIPTLDEILTPTLGGDNKSKLHHAVHNRHPNCVRAHLLNNNGVAPEQLNEALLVAATKGCSDVIRDLVDAGADVHARDHQGRTALLHAVCRDDLGSVETLVTAGADANVMCSSIGIDLDRALMADYVFRTSSCTPIMVAIYKANFEMIRVLIRGGAKCGMAWDFYDLLVYMPMFIHKYTSQQLIELLAIIWQSEGSVGYSLINHVTLKSECDALRQILDHQEPPAPNDCPRIDYALMLEAAVGIGDAEKVAVVLEYRESFDLDIDFPSRDGYSPLLEACLESKDPDTVDILLSHGADPDLQIAAYRNYTPLLMSVQMMKREKNSMHILICLLRNKSKVDIKCTVQIGTNDWVYVSALEYALLCDNLNAAHALVLAGARISESKYTRGDSTVRIDPGFVHCTLEQRHEFIKEHLLSPSPLTTLCRQQARHMLNNDTKRKIDHLPLPQYIKGFLNYSDLEIMAENFQSDMMEFCDDSIPDLSNLTF